MATATQLNLKVDTSNRHILQLALPIAFSFVVPQLNFITNNIFLGGYSEQALAVAGITGVYYLIFAVVGLGLNNGLQALISRRAGEDRVEEIGKLFNQGLILSLAFAVAGITITYFVAPFVLSHALHSATNEKMAINFLYIRIWGLPFLYVYQMRNALLVGINQSRYLVIGTLAETLTNIVLDYTLIYGKWGMPHMGFNGAAVASVIAEITGLVVIFGVMSRAGISRRLRLFRDFALDKVNIKLLLQQSSPLILQHAISIISWEFFYILIEHHGERDLAISNTMRNIFGLFGCVTWSFAATTNAMVSNIIGQGQQQRVPQLINSIMKLSAGFACIIFIILNAIPSFLLQVYGQDDSFIQAAVPVVRIISLALVMQAVSTVWLNAVTGTGNSRMNLITETITIILYCVYVYITLEVLKLPITIGWMSEWLYWICLFIPSFWYMRSGRWQNKKI